MKPIARCFAAAVWLLLASSVWASNASDRPTTAPLSMAERVAQWLASGESAPVQAPATPTAPQPQASAAVEKKMRLVEKAQSLDAQGQLAELEKTAWRLIDEYPASPWGYLFLGRNALFRGQMRAALGWFRQGLARPDRSDGAAAHCLFGAFDALFMLREYQDALLMFRANINMNVSEPEVRERRFLAEIGNYAERGDLAPLFLALGDDQATTPTIWLWDPFFERLTADLLRKDRIDDAAATARAYLRINPASASAWYSLALAEWSAKRNEAGFAAFARAESLAGDRAGWGPRYLLAGNIAAQLEDIDRQIEFYEKALRLGYRTPLLLNNLAWGYYLANKNTEIALTFSQESVRLNPDDAPSLDTLARLQNRVGEKDEALRNINRAIELSLFDPYVEDMRAFRRELTGGQ